jgi:hypothetical protein
MSALSRRSIVASAAALPALAVPAVVSAAVEPDPIYAVIEKDRLLEVAFQARCAYEDGPDCRGIELQRAAPDDDRTPEMAWIVTASVESRWTVATTAPTTMAGLLAVLEYAVSECDRLSSDDLPVCYFDDHAEMSAFIRSMTESVRGLRV